MEIKPSFRRFGGRFARNVAAMAGATAGGQFIVLLSLPILSRLYAPSAFGAAAVFAGLVSLLATIATFRYELGIPLPRNDRAALQLVILAFAILTIVSFIAGLSWFILSPVIELEIGVGTGASAILISIAVFTLGAYQTLNYWLVRKGDFGAIAATRIQQSLVGNGTQIAMGAAGHGVAGLVIGQIVGQCAGIRRLAVTFWADFRRNCSAIRPRYLRWAATRYRHFPLYDSWAALINVAGAQSPIILLAALFSPTLAGYYTIAYRLLSAPIGLIGKAVSQPLLARIVEERRSGTASILVAKLLKVLALISLPPFGVAIALAPDIVPFVFGTEWSGAALVVAWTATWVAWQFICSPISVVLIALEAQKLNAILQALLLILRVFPLLLGAALGSADVAIAGFSIFSMAGYICYTVMICKRTGLMFSEMILSIYRPALLSLLPVAAALFAPSLLAKVVAVMATGACWIVLVVSIAREQPEGGAARARKDLW